MATAEFAVAVPAVILVIVLALSAVSTAVDQVRCLDAARATARLLARGDSPQRAIAQGHTLAPPGAELSVSQSGGDIEVRVVGRPRAALAWLGARATPQGMAVAAREGDQSAIGPLFAPSVRP